MGSWLSVLTLLALAACLPRNELAGELACEELRWQGPPQRVSLVLLVGDTVRRDRLGAYGGAARTPAFDAFAARGLRFERAFSQAPWTKPSIATLFTSTFPSQHGLASDPQLRALGRPGGDALTVDRLSSGFDTLAEVLSRAGYRTGAFVGNPWMEARFGFSQGFEEYDDSFASWDVSGEVVSRSALAWLEGIPRDRPFFLYVHYMDAHRPYPGLSRVELEAYARSESKRPLSPRALESLKASPVRLEGGRSVTKAGFPLTLELFDLVYNKGVEQFDQALGVFLDGFEKLPGADSTALMVVSDHGEALYERGYGSHGKHLHDEEIAIPMAWRLPGVSSESDRVGCGVGLIDVLPTLCEYLGVECPAQVFGRSLLPGQPGRGPPRDLVSEGVMHRPAQRTIRTRDYKLVYDPRGSQAHDPAGYSLYDLRNDPGERRDLLAGTSSDESRAIAEELAARLRDSVATFERPAPEPVLVPETTAERLRALGYADP